MPRPTDTARIELAKATPTVATDGNVVKWEVEMKYSLNGYHSTYHHEFEPGTLKAETAWTRAELIAECPTVQWANVFDSQYESAGPNAGVGAPVRRSDFDHRRMV